jgi:TIR domain
MIVTVVRFDHVVLEYQSSSASFSLTLEYTPVGRDEDGRDVALTHQRFARGFAQDAITPTLKRKVERFVDYLMAAFVPIAQLRRGGSVAQSNPAISYFKVRPDYRDPVEPQGRFLLDPTYVELRYQTTAGSNQSWVQLSFKRDEVPTAAIRLVDNMRPTFEQMAWNDMWQRLGGDAEVLVQPKKKVFISYRSGHQDFAEAIAHRLGREGFLPWYDGWEILAGDSIIREMQKGFASVYAIILVLTPDYPEGKWAREEMENAITKRVEEEIRIIPVMYEKAPIPELLKSIRYVDCTDHSDGAFEKQFGQIIDALNEIELNPYR